VRSLSFVGNLAAGRSVKYLERHQISISSQEEANIYRYIDCLIPVDYRYQVPYLVPSKGSSDQITNVPFGFDPLVSIPGRNT